MTMQSDIGLIGLAVMGENLALNMESKGFSVAVFNRTTAVTEKFVATRGKGKKITPTSTIEEFIGALKRPRKAMMMMCPIHAERCPFSTLAMGSRRERTQSKKFCM